MTAKRTRRTFGGSITPFREAPVRHTCDVPCQEAGSPSYQPGVGMVYPPGYYTPAYQQMAAIRAADRHRDRRQHGDDVVSVPDWAEEAA